MAILATSLFLGIASTEAIAQQLNDNTSNPVISNSLLSSGPTSEAITLPEIFNKTENSVVPNN